MDAERIEELLAVYQRTRNIEARDELAEAFIGAVCRIASRIFGRSSRIEDRVTSAAYVGLVTAIETYDPSRGARFGTHLWHKVRLGIADELRDGGWFPRGMKRVNGKPPSMRSLEYRFPDGSTLADVISEHRAAAHAAENETWSVSDMCPAKGSRQAERTDAQVAKAECLDSVLRYLERASGREQLILTRRFLEGKSMKEIADEIGVTAGRVSQIMTKLLGRPCRNVETDVSSR